MSGFALTSTLLNVKMPYVRSILCTFCRLNITEPGPHAAPGTLVETAIIPNECTHLYHTGCAEFLVRRQNETKSSSTSTQAADDTKQTSSTESVQTTDVAKSTADFDDLEMETTTAQATLSPPELIPIQRTKSPAMRIFSCCYEHENVACIELVDLDDARTITTLSGFTRCTASVIEDADRSMLQSQLQASLAETVAIRHDLNVATSEVIRHESITASLTERNRQLAAHNADLIAAIQRRYPDFDVNTFFETKSLPKSATTLTKHGYVDPRTRRTTEMATPPAETSTTTSPSMAHLSNSPLYNLYAPVLAATQSADAQRNARSYKHNGSLVFERSDASTGRSPLQSFKKPPPPPAQPSTSTSPATTPPPKRSKVTDVAAQRTRTNPDRVERQTPAAKPPRGAGRGLCPNQDQPPAQNPATVRRQEPPTAPPQVRREVKAWALPFVIMPDVNAGLMTKAEFIGSDDAAELGLFLSTFLVIGEGLAQILVRNQIMSRAWGRSFKTTTFYRPSVSIEDFSDVIMQLPSLPPESFVPSETMRHVKKGMSMAFANESPNSSTCFLAGACGFW